MQRERNVGVLASKESNQNVTLGFLPFRECSENVTLGFCRSRKAATVDHIAAARSEGRVDLYFEWRNANVTIPSCLLIPLRALHGRNYTFLSQIPNAYMLCKNAQHSRTTLIQNTPSTRRQSTSRQHKPKFRSGVYPHVFGRRPLEGGIVCLKSPPFGGGKKKGAHMLDRVGDFFASFPFRSGENAAGVNMWQDFNVTISFW